MTDNKSVNNGPLFIEMANYSSPVIVEDRGKQWVNYGEDNNYFEYLLDRYRGSPTNHAIINGVADAIVGNGIASEQASRDPRGYLLLKTLFPDDNLRKWAFDLKCYGFYMQVVIMAESMDEIARIDYTPVQNWRSGLANEDGEIKEMFYSDDWQQYRKKQYAPKSYPVYDPEQSAVESVIVVKPFRSGSFYYPTVDYQGALQYANIEEEIANFHLNNIMNGLSPSMLINFNNGDPGDVQRKKMERLIQNKWGGTSNTAKFILSFNDNKESAATIESAPVSDLDKQYQFLSEESTKKIMVGHRITSPFFFGIRDSAGFGSNADEIKNSWVLFERTVLHGYRSIMISNIEKIMDDMGYHIPVDFISMTPIDFAEEPQTTLKSDKEISNVADELINMGEDVDLNEWELIDERKVDYDLEDSRDLLLNLATAPSSNPNGKSEQDTNLFKVRYVYAPDKVTTRGGEVVSRDFCSKMVKAKKVYRKEDIQAASDRPVNPGWGPKGANTYDLWLYKGGGDCHHFWMRQTYLRRNNKKISVNEARKRILDLPPNERKDEQFEKNDSKVAKRPTDMPNNGFIKKR